MHRPLGSGESRGTLEVIPPPFLLIVGYRGSRLTTTRFVPVLLFGNGEQLAPRRPANPRGTWDLRTRPPNEKADRPRKTRYTGKSQLQIPFLAETDST